MILSLGSCTAPHFDMWYIIPRERKSGSCCCLEVHGCLANGCAEVEGWDVNIDGYSRWKKKWSVSCLPLLYCCLMKRCWCPSLFIVKVYRKSMIFPKSLWGWFENMCHNTKLMENGKRNGLIINVKKQRRGMKDGERLKKKLT